ncbi:MAG: hypothetical protein UT05_C0004G0005 [Parcubacteria group bacterium GW2011_GWF2_38_76]|nr:MAG: hypothetical protein UT05_C0004G0005 [Parcubacteria group bacterium GW2011_GWF2_38_76]
MKEKKTEKTPKKSTEATKKVFVVDLNGVTTVVVSDTDNKEKDYRPIDFLGF